jgi:hypothetical protein
LADHKDAAFLELKALLTPFGMTQWYTDDWGPTAATLSLKNTRLAKLIPNGLNANISPCVPGLNA